jgi:hypothetical protein
MCGAEDTVARVDVPPRAVGLMENAGPIAVRDVVGAASVHFCASDWTFARDLVLNLDGTPLSRCNAAWASFDLADDYEALTNATKDPDQPAVERRMREAAAEVLARREDAADRAVVEALVVRRALAELEAVEAD